MDSKQLLTALLFGALMMMGYFYFFGNKAAAPPASTNPAGLMKAIGLPASAIKEETVQLGSPVAGSGFKLAVTVNNFTAGIDRVELNVENYSEIRLPGTPLTLLEVQPGALKPFATTSIQIEGESLPRDLRNVTWEFIKPANPNPLEARLELKLIGADNAPLLDIEKVIRIDPASYNITVEHIIRNVTTVKDKPGSGRALKVHIDQLGPTAFPADSIQTDMRNYQAAAYNTAQKYIEPDKKMIAELTAIKNLDGDPLGEFQGTDHLVWVAASNRFFTALVRPLSRPGNKTEELQGSTSIPVPDFLSAASVTQVGPDVLPKHPTVGIYLTGNDVSIPPGDPTQKETQDWPRFATTVAPGAPVVLPLAVYLGPKSRAILAGDHTAEPSTSAFQYWLYRYSNVIHFSQGGLCAFLTSEKLAIAILWLLDLTHRYLTFGNWGLAIILLVIVVRLCLHPLTRYSQVNMAVMQRKMAKLQPEIERVKKKFEKDKTRQQQELMAVYKEHNVNPAGGIMGCLPMFLQMPIWIALYGGLAVDIDLRYAPFIRGWINDLSNPDTILPRHIPVIGHPLFTLPLVGDIYGLNLLPLLLAVVFYLQMQLQMKTMPKPADDSQAQTQKISQWMVMIFPIFLYNAPSGLNLYIFASTIGGLFDSWLVRRHLRQHDLMAAAPAK